MSGVTLHNPVFIAFKRHINNIRASNIEQAIEECEIFMVMNEYLISAIAGAGYASISAKSDYKSIAKSVQSLVTGMYISQRPINNNDILAPLAMNLQTIIKALSKRGNATGSLPIAAAVNIGYGINEMLCYKGIYTSLLAVMYGLHVILPRGSLLRPNQYDVKALYDQFTNILTSLTHATGAAISIKHVIELQTELSKLASVLKIEMELKQQNVTDIPLHIKSVMYESLGFPPNSPFFWSFKNSLEEYGSPKTLPILVYIYAFLGDWEKISSLVSRIKSIPDKIILDDGTVLISILEAAIREQQWDVLLNIVDKVIPTVSYRYIVNKHVVPDDFMKKLLIKEKALLRLMPIVDDNVHLSYSLLDDTRMAPGMAGVFTEEPLSQFFANQNMSTINSLVDKGFKLPGHPLHSQCMQQLNIVAMQQARDAGLLVFANILKALKIDLSTKQKMQLYREQYLPGLEEFLQKHDYNLQILSRKSGIRSVVGGEAAKFAATGKYNAKNMPGKATFIRIMKNALSKQQRIIRLKL